MNSIQFFMTVATIDEEYLTSFSRVSIYLWNDEYECFIKSVPGMGFWAKFPGKAEYPISSDSKIVVLAVFGGQTVSKEIYENT